MPIPDDASTLYLPDAAKIGRRLAGTRYHLAFAAFLEGRGSLAQWAKALVAVDGAVLALDGWLTPFPNVSDSVVDLVHGIDWDDVADHEVSPQLTLARNSREWLGGPVLEWLASHPRGLSLTRGEPTKVSAVLQAPKGTDVGTVVAKTNVQARFRNPIDDHLDTVELTGPPGGPFTGTYTPATDVTANAMEVVVEGRITTAAGASLLSQSAVSEQLVRRPGDAVQFAPASLKLPSLKGHGVTETSLVLVGGKTEGCVWFVKTSVPEAPDGAGPIVLTADDGPLPAERFEHC